MSAIKRSSKADLDLDRLIQEEKAKRKRRECYWREIPCLLPPTLLFMIFWVGNNGQTTEWELHLTHAEHEGNILAGFSQLSFTSKLTSFPLFAKWVEAIWFIRSMYFY